MNIRERFIGFFCFLNICFSISGRVYDYQLFENIHLSAEASVISYFIQDTQGLMWIGSDKGLYSYDGYSAQAHYTVDKRENTRIYCGVLVHDSYLYLGSDNGLLIYNYRTDQYEEPDIPFPSDIRALTLYENDLWIGTLNGLYIYHFPSGELRFIDKKTNPGLPHETIYSLILSESRRIYIGTYNGLCFYEDNSFREIPLPLNQSRSNRFVNVLLEDTVRNCIWIGTEGELFKYIPQTGKMECIETFHTNSVKSLALDQQQKLLVGTDNGLYVYNENEPLLHIIHDSRNMLSLSNNIIWNIFTDKEKNSWLATDYGISLSRFNRDFQYIPIAQITGSGDGNHFYSLFKDSKGNYWFGGSNGLIRFNELDGNRENTTWYKMGNKHRPLSHNRIRHIYEDKNHNLWIATDGGVNRFDYNTEQFVHYNIVDSTNTYNCNWAYNILEDDKGQLWIATCLGGIFIVDKESLLSNKTGNYKAEYNFNMSNGLSGMFVSQIVPDQEGYLWVLLYNNAGIDKINMKTREVTPIPTTEMIGEQNFSYIIRDSSGIIWMGSRKGLVRFVPKTNRAELIKLNEFNNNEVLSIIEVNDDLWISRTDGIWVMNKQTFDSQRLKIMNRVFTSLFYDADKDRIFMGSVDGFVITSSDILQPANTRQPIVFTSLYVNNRLMTFNNQISPQSIRYSDWLVLEHNQNNLALEISDLLYAPEEKNNFIYKLNDFDKEWNLLRPNSNRITFNNLSPGSYQLMISRLNANGKPSEEHYTLNIRIKPPWYLTVWAKCIYLLFFLALIVWIINFYRVKYRLRKEQQEKEKLLEQSQAKIDFFAEMAADLTSPLSLIVAPISKMLLELKNPTEKKQLEEVRNQAMRINSFVHQKLEEEIQAKSLLEQMTKPKEEAEIISYDEKFLFRITEIIEERISDPDLNVSALCEVSEVNNKQLYRKIKQLTDVTPVEYIKMIRMRKAAMLLKQKKLTIAEVMYKVGYSNHSYFSKCFQSEYGKTPKQYMEETLSESE